MAVKTEEPVNDPAPKEATAQIDPTKVELLLVRSAGPESDLAYPDFTYRHNWDSRNGPWRLTLRDPRIRSSSNVFVSISELEEFVTSGDPVPKPHMGAARFSVYNVVPRNGEVEILVEINWPSPLLTQVSYLVINP